MIIRIVDNSPHILGVDPIKFPPWNIDNGGSGKYDIYSYVDDSWAFVIGACTIEKPHKPSTTRRS